MSDESDLTWLMSRLIWVVAWYIVYLVGFIMDYDKWALTRENLFWEFANNKGKDQPVLSCRLINTFVIPISESIISKLATREIPIF